MSAAVTLMPGLRRLTAPNGGPMTYRGTNSYLLGRRQIAVIDPGPDDPAHRDELLRAIDGAEVVSIIVTHAHLDHSAGAQSLSRALGVPISAYGRATAGRSPSMAALAQRAELAGGEGLDRAFKPDVALQSGARLDAIDWQLHVLHTPGHLSSHISLACPKLGVIFTGDTVMGWSTTLISPPDGSVSAFLASLELLIARPETQYLPGHGDPVADGPAVARRQAAHRRRREAQILAVLADGQARPAEITTRLYSEVPRHLHPAAMRNVLAHLIDISEQGRLRLPDGDLTRALYRLDGRP